MRTQSTVLYSILFLSCNGFITNSSQAISYGVYDNRTLGLGGTSVAIADVRSGFYYNPALSAFHTGDEDKTRDGRVSLGFIAPQISKAAEVAAKAVDDDIEGQLTTAIDNYNAQPSAETAGAGLNAARDLQQTMTDLQDKSIYGDIYLGFSIAEPGDQEGGAFFMGSRVIVAGVTNITEGDVALVEDYIEALDFVVPGGPAGQEHSELYQNGMLTDPSDQIESSAEARGVVLSEIGVSAGKMFEFWGQDLALGFTPKIVQVNTFDDQWRIEDGNFDGSDDEDRHLYANFDLGAALPLGEHFRVGLAIKDLFTKTYATELGNPIYIKPRSRLGLAYQRGPVALGFDYDLSANDSIYQGIKTQDASLGLEIQLRNFIFLRGGYRSDLQGNYGNTLSAGLGIKLAFFEMEVALSQGEEELGGGFSLSIRR